MTNCDKLPWRPVCSVHNFNEFSTGPMMARHASVVVTLPRNLFFCLENHAAWNNITIPFSIELSFSSSC